MTTSPAGGWRDRLNDLQREAQRLALVASDAARVRWTRVRAWLSQELSALRRSAGPRFDEWIRILRSDLGVITGVQGSRAAPRLAAAAHAASRGADRVGAVLGHGASLALAAMRDAIATWRARSAIRAEEPEVPRGQDSQVVAEPGDDLATVLGRIDGAQGADVVLVVPRGVASLRTPAAWLRVAGHARRRGMNLSVVAARRDVRAYATQTGLVAARSVRGLPGARSRLGAIRETAWPSVLALGIGLFILVTGLGYTVPTARIEVAPPAQPLEAELQVRINPLATAIDVPARVLPATVVQRTVRAVVSVPTSGAVKVGDRPAIVRLEFRNAGSTPIEVPQGSVVRDPARFAFATSEPLRLGAGESASVDAIAMRPGTAGNLPPGALRVLDDAPSALSVTNPAPAHGGSDRVAPGVSQADVDRVHRMAEDVLTRVAVRQLSAEYTGGLVLHDGASIAILSQQPFQQLEEAAEVFVAEYVARAAVQVVLPETARQFAERHAATLVPPGRELVGGAASATLESAGNEGGRAYARITVKSATAAQIDGPALAAQVAGVNPTDARALLKSKLQLASEPTVQIGPRWFPWPWLPSRGGRIEFAIVRAESKPEPGAPSAPGAVAVP